jgi:formate dehydrogenase major subunit
MFALNYHDLGTPPSPLGAAGRDVVLEIDGLAVTVPEGTSIMRAAALLGRSIPKLCATDTLKAFGSCRLCLVEIEGRRGFPASCTTPVADGLKVRTTSEALERLRRNVLELYISDHPLDCISCPANGHCELQDTAAQLGVTESRYGLAGRNHRDAAKDTSNVYFNFDPAMCIACSRCVRACDEVQGTLALTIQGRGFDSKVAASQNDPFMQSECVSCGACVEACPTVALTEKSLIQIGQPERVVTTTCAYCGVGCSFNVEVKGDQVVRMVPDRNGHANHGHACVKGRFAFGYATHPDRITTPLIRRAITDPWQEATWDEAIGHAAAEFRRIQAKYGRDSIGGIPSSRCTNEEAFLVQKLVRAAFGNNNVDTCARVCHSPTGYGLKNTIGESAGTQAFDSVMKADVILVVGANPTDGHPVFASQLKRRLRQGAKLIVVDPRRIGLTRTPHITAAHHLQLQPGTNVALINALSHVIVTEGLTREQYIAERCDVESYRQWKTFIAAARNSPEATADATGVPAESVRQAARLFANAPNAAIYYGLGVTEHSQGTTMVMAIAQLAMATGNLGREGVGVSP